jgi:hypothetical protein
LPCPHRVPQCVQLSGGTNKYHEKLGKFTSDLKRDAAMGNQHACGKRMCDAGSDRVCGLPMCRAVLCSALLCSALLCCALPCRAVPCCAVLCRAVHAGSAGSGKSEAARLLSGATKDEIALTRKKRSDAAMGNQHASGKRMCDAGSDRVCGLTNVPCRAVPCRAVLSRCCAVLCRAVRVAS